MNCLKIDFFRFEEDEEGGAIFTLRPDFPQTKKKKAADKLFQEFSESVPRTYRKIDTTDTFFESTYLEPTFSFIKWTKIYKFIRLFAFSFYLCMHEVSV